MPRLLPCGETALLIELDGLDEVLALAGRLRAAALPGLVEVVPAARTVLATASSAAALAALIPALRQTVRDAAARGATPTPPAKGARRPRNFAGDVPTSGAESPGAPAPAAPTPAPVTIRVRYDGPDLDEVAWLTGLTPDEVVEAHTGTAWRAAFGGFAPGFVYLTGGDPRLRVPRRASPRTAVPPGAVGLADEFSGVYPRESPGGWQLIGRTDARLWDAAADPPALIVPGALVRFEAAP